MPDVTRFVTLTLCGLAGSALAGDDPVETTTRIVGLSADGLSYGVRRSTRVHEDTQEGDHADEKSRCGYLGSAELPSPDAVELSWCKVGGACAPLMPVFALPAAGSKDSVPLLDPKRCTSEKKSDENFARARAALTAQEIDLQRGPLPLETRDEQRLGWAHAVTVPADSLSEWGLTQAVSLSLECPTQSAPPTLRATIEGERTSVTVFSFTATNKCLFFDQAVLTPAAVVGTARTLLYQTPVASAEREKAFSGAPFDLSLARLASRLLNQRGLEAHRARQYTEAARDFERASTADATFGLAFFNRACSLALAGDAEGALAALREALRLDRPGFVAKARREPDLSSLRKATEFSALMR